MKERSGSGERSQVPRGDDTSSGSGERKPTILDVARRARVSKSLVSMVIRGDEGVSDARRRAVLEAITALGYRPNAMARGLVQRRTRLVGVVISNLRNPFFGDVASGVLEEAMGLDYRVLFTTGDGVAAREEEAIESLLELRVDGLILATSRADEGTIGRVAHSVPTVVLNRETSDGASDSVTNDHVMGAEMAVEHCLSLGHRRIAHIDGGASPAATMRRTGYQQAMDRLGLSSSSIVVGGAFTESGGYRGAQALLGQHPLPTAIFAANDLCAIGALNALEEVGLKIPGDVSLVGYDDSSLAALRHVSLTSIHQPGGQMGRMAMELLVERIHEGRTEPRHHVIVPSLVVRSTTGPPPPEGSAGRGVEVPFARLEASHDHEERGGGA